MICTSQVLLTRTQIVDVGQWTEMIQYSEVPLKRGPIYHVITYDTAITMAKSKSHFIIITDSPYGMYFVNICEKIDCVETAPHCTKQSCQLLWPNLAASKGNDIFCYIIAIYRRWSETKTWVVSFYAFCPHVKDLSKLALGGLVLSCLFMWLKFMYYIYFASVVDH